MQDLSVAICSIALTQRRRYFWAAWWTGPPTAIPFRKPDASHGGAPTREAALAEAESAAGRTLSLDDPRWARAWLRVLRGQTPWASREAAEPSARSERRTEVVTATSIWRTLGVSERATVLEIKAAFRIRAKATHPDLGGSSDDFRELKRAYEEALKRSEKAAKRPRKRAKG